MYFLYSVWFIVIEMLLVYPSVSVFIALGFISLLFYNILVLKVCIDSFIELSLLCWSWFGCWCWLGGWWFGRAFMCGVVLFWLIMRRFLICLCLGRRHFLVMRFRSWVGNFLILVGSILITCCCVFLVSVLLLLFCFVIIIYCYSVICLFIVIVYLLSYFY